MGTQTADDIINSRIIGYTFIYGRDCICFVLIKDEISDKEKAYCGVCSGKNDVDDVFEVWKTGQKFPAAIARQLAEQYGVIIKR